MERNFVPDSWVGHRVMIVPFDEGGTSLPERRGWLVGVTDEGIVFAQEFWDDSLGKLLPEKASRVYPWDTLALVTLLRSGHPADEGQGGGGGGGSQEEPPQQRS
jgi:hypothetical protein